MSETPRPTLFVVILRYLVPLDAILEQRDEHLKFLDKYYEQGIFQASGPQIPRTGGIIIAKAASRDALENILKEDPFSLYKLAEYQVFEFVIDKKSRGFHQFVEAIH